jgi:hypothetical protein
MLASAFFLFELSRAGLVEFSGPFQTRTKKPQQRFEGETNEGRDYSGPVLGASACA